MSVDDIQRLHADHRYARQSLELLRTAVSCHARPPAGHAFLRMLQEAAAYFEQELPRHMLDEEMNVFPHYLGLEGSRDLWRLREEHQDLWALSEEFARWAERFASDPTDARWHMVREHALDLEGLMQRHLAHEEEVMRRLAKAESAEAPGPKTA